jgi:hypothetical protein
MSARDLRAKIAAYRDYRDSGAFARDYDGFPTVLVVALHEDAEDRFARAVRETPAGRNGPLPVLLATRGRIAASSSGPLGGVWRGAWSDALSPWPEGSGAATRAAFGRPAARRAHARGA